MTGIRDVQLKVGLLGEADWIYQFRPRQDQEVVGFEVSTIDAFGVPRLEASKSWLPNGDHITLVQATAAGLAMTALREKGMDVVEMAPNIASVSHGGQRFILEVRRAP